VGSPADAQPPTPAAAPRDRAASPARPWWRTALAAQESGLVVVIALMMLALAYFGGSKQATVRVDAPPGVEVREAGEGTIELVQGGRVLSTHTAEGRWRIRAQDDGSTQAFGPRTVNKFLDTENLIIVTTNASFIAIMAVGMTAIIILAGIDLSVGSIYALAAILGAMALRSGLGEHPGAASAVPLALLVCCGVGAACGFVNGFSSVALRVHPFIITLGAMAIYRGLVFVITKGETISAPESLQTGFFKATPFAARGAGGVAPVPTLIMLGVAALGVFTLGRTVFGRRIYAIGGNETAARYAGVHVGLVKTAVYTLSGLLAGLSACIYLGYYGAAETNAGQGYELNVIAAAVIGGASLSGGRGSAFGAVLGAVLVQLISNGMVILGIDQSYNQIVMGLAIIVAVVVDQAKVRLTGR
jgi:ribose transport system permease protein